MPVSRSPSNSTDDSRNSFAETVPVSSPEAV